MPNSLLSRIKSAATRLVVCGLGAACAVTLAGCGSSAGPASGNSNSGKVEVVTSFYPLTYMAQQIGGDAITVTDLTPVGGTAHDLELSPNQVAQIGRADLVVLLGGGFQPAVEAAATQQDTPALDGMEVVTPGEMRDGDAHVWLNPVIMARIGDSLAEQLSKIAPDSAATFRAGAARFGEEMKDLDDSYRSGLSGCEGATMVTSHEAFGYLADAYGLNQVGITGINPEAEPSPKRLREIAKVVDEYGVKTLFLEQTVSASTETRLADSVGSSTALLQTLESPPDEGGTYVSVMEKNLEVLEKGLVCKG